MAFDFKTATPDTSFAPATAFLLGADTQSATDPSIYAGSVLVTAFMGGLASADAIKWNNDAILTRAAAATLQLGAADAAAPVAQTFQVQSVVAGTSNTAGADFSIYGSKSTGSGAGGSIKFYTSPAGGSGTSQNVGVLALTIDSTKLATFAGKAVFGGASLAGSTFIGVQGGNVIATNSTSTFTSTAYGVGYLSGGSFGAFIGYNGSSYGALLSSAMPLGWTSAGVDGTDPDTILIRDAANTLALRNGTNAQTFNVYKTYTDASNYERLTVGVSSGVLGIFCERAGTGGTNDLYLDTDNRMFLDVLGNRAWVISASRTLYPGNTLSTTMTDNFLNMPGAAGAPTGVPATTTGFPFYYDSTNNKIYVYNGSWRSTAALT